MNPDPLLARDVALSVDNNNSGDGDDDPKVVGTVTAPPCLGPRLLLGQVVATPGAITTMAVHGIHAMQLLSRHVTGDWGDLDDEDKALNDAAVRHGDRILSAYVIAPDVRIWVITEWDRSVTTLLLPSEY